MNEDNIKEYNILTEENERARTKLERLLDTPTSNRIEKDVWKNKIWRQINTLIENEIEQEELCNW